MANEKKERKNTYLKHNDNVLPNIWLYLDMDHQILNLMHVLSNVFDLHIYIYLFWESFRERKVNFKLIKSSKILIKSKKKLHFDEK